MQIKYQNSKIKIVEFLNLAFCILIFDFPAKADPNLVGYWNFNDGAVTDLSGNGNNGTLMGNAALSDFKDLVFGGSGFSLDLNFQNRNTDWVEIPHSDSLNITHELTILAWIRPDDIENGDGVVTKGKQRVSWSLRFNNTNGLRFTGNAGFSLTDPNDPNFAPQAVGTGDRQSMFEVSEVNVPAGIEWSFVGVVSDTKQVRFILNLEQEALPVSYIFAESNEPLVLGYYLPGDDYFNGLMDEVRLYNRALSAREVITISGLARKPFEPEPADGAVGVTSGTLTWGRVEGTDKVYLGTDPGALALVSADAAGSYTIAQLTPGQRYFWRVDAVTADAVVTGDVWSFTVAQNTASGPLPSDGAEFVGVEGLSLSWIPAFGARAYDVYFGMNSEALGLLGQVSQTSYEDPNKQLPSGTVHYWRVDAVKKGEVAAGPVWSFQTMPIFPIEPNLVAWYKFDRGEGRVAIDWTRKGNDGMIVGDTKWIEKGYAGRALSFDGAGDYVEIPRVVQDDWTIMLWLRTDNPAQTYGNLPRVRNGAGLIDGDAGGQTNNFAMSLNQRKVVVNCMATGQGDGNALASNTNIEDTDWHHAAWTRIAATGEMALFIDGALDNSGQQDKWKGTKDAQNFIWIGGIQYANNQNYFAGQLDEVKFFNRVLNADQIKVEMRPDKRQPFSPKPPPGSVLDQEKPVTLVWKPGVGATAHNVYLGISEDKPQLVSAAQDANQYNAGLLEPATYYWQIGEIQADGAEVKSNIWNFIVADYLIVDDFEDYNDYEPDRIFDTWIDGWTDPANGSQVGYATPPFAEQTIVHEGKQSMPLFYNNTGGVTYSQAERTFAPAQDWTRKAVRTLTLWLRGQQPPGSFSFDPATQRYTLIADGADIWGTADNFHFVYKRLSGNGSITAKVERVDPTHNWAKAGVMIRETLDADSVNAFSLVSAPGTQNRARMQYRLTKGSDTGQVQTAQNAVTLPRWVRLTRTGNVFTAEHSADGVTWEIFAPQTIIMGTDVYIGLAATSHVSQTFTTAVFSNISVIGNVTPAGQFSTSTDIGIDTNLGEPLYVALEDSSNKVGLVKNSDPNATQQISWQQWNIDLNEFSNAGVNLRAIKKMIIGVGDRSNPQPGSSGKMYFDDIRLYPQSASGG